MLTLGPRGDEVLGREALTAALGPRFVISDFDPAYLRVEEEGRLAAKVDAALPSSGR